jgi:hypothetical protein
VQILLLGLQMGAYWWTSTSRAVCQVCKLFTLKKDNNDKQAASLWHNSIRTLAITITITKWAHKVRRRWGHPEGANSGSNGKLEFMPNAKWLPPSRPNPLPAMYIRPAQFDLQCADRLTQPTASQALYIYSRFSSLIALVDWSVR